MRACWRRAYRECRLMRRRGWLVSGIEQGFVRYEESTRAYPPRVRRALLTAVFGWMP